MKDNSIIIVLKDGIQIREPIETNNYIYKSGKVVGLLSSLSETHCLLLANLLKLIKMLCSYFVQQRQKKEPPVWVVLYFHFLRMGLHQRLRDNPKRYARRNKALN